MRNLKLTLFAAAMTAVFSFPRICEACEYCIPVLTLSEQVDQADAVVLAKWISANQTKTETEDEFATGTTKYRVIEVVKNLEGEAIENIEIALPEYRSGKAGDLAMLFAIKVDELEWGDPVTVTEASYKYFKNSPDLDTPLPERLIYYLDFLEYPDDMVANDAYGEFAAAPFVEIKKLKQKLPREKLREWVKDPETAVTRLGLYGLMLGLCGDEEDARLMKARITEPLSEDNQFRVGVDGIMAGYLILTGEEGLKVLEDTRLKKGVKVPYSETLAAMQAVRFSWNYDERIEKDRLKRAMRLLLDRPDIIDLAIADLARWKDWEIQDQLLAIYDQKEYEIPSVKRSIVRYFLAASKMAKDEKHVTLAKKHLETLRKKDPKTVKQSERFFYFD